MLDSTKDRDFEILLTALTSNLLNAFANFPAKALGPELDPKSTGKENRLHPAVRTTRLPQTK